jgi:hypothetical protein
MTGAGDPRDTAVALNYSSSLVGQLEPEQSSRMVTEAPSDFRDLGDRSCVADSLRRP